MQHPRQKGRVQKGVKRDVRFGGIPDGVQPK